MTSSSSSNKRSVLFLHTRPWFSVLVAGWCDGNLNVSFWMSPKGISGPAHVGCSSPAHTHSLDSLERDGCIHVQDQQVDDCGIGFAVALTFQQSIWCIAPDQPLKLALLWAGGGMQWFPGVCTQMLVCKCFWFMHPKYALINRIICHLRKGAWRVLILNMYLET